MITRTRSDIIQDAIISTIYQHLFVIDNLIKKYGQIPKKKLINRPCPICNKKKNKVLIKKDKLQIVQCLQCDFIFTNPILNRQYYQNIYQSKDYQDLIDLPLYQMKLFCFALQRL